MNYSILIADDEPHARRYLKSLISKFSDTSEVFECKNGEEVLEFVSHKTIDILFLDINMPGLNGIEVASKLIDTNSLIIFCTAYDQYALNAFELEAFDYLLKPFENKRFQLVLNRAKSTLEIRKQANFSSKFAELFYEYNQSLSPHLSEFIIKEKGFEKKIAVNDVLYLEASSVYVVINLLEKKYLYRVALNLLEQQLPNYFIRIHRSFIINSKQVVNCKYLNNSTYMLQLKNDETIISSRKYKEVIAKKFS